MQTTRTNLWTYLTIFALFCAGFFRFINLGSAPLSDSEAIWAMEAVEVANADGIRSLVSIDPQPAYIFLTAYYFKLFGVTNFGARFWPALAGFFLVFAPVLWQQKKHNIFLFIATIGLALDPGLVTVSRQAGGPMLAVSSFILAIVFIIIKQPVLAGILAGVALLSGPSVYPGLLAAVIVWFLMRQSINRNHQAEDSQEILQAEESSIANIVPSTLTLNKEMRNIFIISGISTVLLLGTMFLRFPQGLAAWADSFTAYLTGWTTPGNVSPISSLIAVIVFEPFAMGFAAIGGFRWLYHRSSLPIGERNLIILIVSCFFILFALVVIYPGRQVSDMGWVLFPLWIMASLELRTALPSTRNNNVSILLAALILILASLFWISLVGTKNLVPTGSIAPETIQIALPIGIISLGILTSVLIALGWNVEISRLGTMWGLAIVGIIYSLSAMWGASQLRTNQPSEIWPPLPGTGQENLMIKNLEDFSNRNTGRSNTIQITSTIDWPSLRWSLRDFPNVVYTSALSTEAMPAAIITPIDQDEPIFSASYRGQDFTWRTWPGWEGSIPPDFMNWLTFRSAPIIPEKIILWIRGDQFPGGTIIPNASEEFTP